MPKQAFLNTYIDNLSMTETVSAVDGMVKAKKKSYVVAVNTDVIIKIDQDQELKEIVDKADLTVVDGQPLVWVARRRGIPLKERVSGSDLVPKLCELASKKGYKIFIIGGKDGVADNAKKNLEKDFNGIKVVGTYAPPFGFEKDVKELKKINKMISDVKPDLLFACFGCPKQEKWIYENISKYTATVSVCAGATVDFLAGNVKRAPKWMSNMGLEWLYRFTRQPRRLFKRYFVDDLAIFRIMRKYK